MFQFNNYRKFLLNRVTTTQNIADFIESCVTSEDEEAKHYFHKIMVHNWSEPDIQLFDVLSEYFGASFIPVNFTCLSNLVTSFYTSSLTLILKMIKLDFMFPHKRNMFNIDILFNDKTSSDCFDKKVSVEEIITGVVCRRFSDNCELDLTDFCNDEEFQQKNIRFYKLSLLSNFKILMIRMGRDTKILNLSNNNLKHVPQDILNFFMKGDLIEVNFSNNNFSSINEISRISSKVERLWVEGNPLCDDIDPSTYIKQLCVRCPRLAQVDGVNINNFGLMLPFNKNYVCTPNKKTKIVIDKFIHIYFGTYDSERLRLNGFYDRSSLFTLSHNLPENKEEELKHYMKPSRNWLDPQKKIKMKIHKKIYKGKEGIPNIFHQLPPTVHDTSTFTVDILHHDNKHLMLILGGIYKEKRPKDGQDNFLYFRRTFLFKITTTNKQNNCSYVILNEMLTVTLATKEQIENTFKHPILNMNKLVLKNPDPEDVETLCRVFMHLTQLKRSEAEAFLMAHNLELKLALKDFIRKLKKDEISADKFLEVDDFSDTSSLLDEVD